MFGEESLLDEEDINGPGLCAVRQATACCLRDSELVKIMPPPPPLVLSGHAASLTPY